MNDVSPFLLGMQSFEEHDVDDPCDVNGFVSLLISIASRSLFSTPEC